MKTLSYAAGLLCTAVLVAGCGDSNPTPNPPGGGPGTTKVAQICPKCAQKMGSEACCDADAEKCQKCGFAKGSPGCCNAEFLALIKDEDVKSGKKPIEICADCGQIKGGDSCCKEGAVVCEACKKHKGSPGCVLLCGPKNAKPEVKPEDNPPTKKPLPAPEPSL